MVSVFLLNIIPPDDLWTATVSLILLFSAVACVSGNFKLIEKSECIEIPC